MIEFRANIVPPTRTAQQKGVFVNKFGRARFFEKSSVRSAREVLMAAFREFAPETPIGEPVIARLKWIFPYRKSERKSVVRLGLEISHSTRPDLDNLEKMALDVLVRLGFLVDDSLIFRKVTSKVRGPDPGIEVQLLPESESYC